MSQDAPIPEVATPPPGPDDPFRPGRMLTIAGGHAAHDTYVAFLPMLLPRFVERFDLSNTQAGWLSACT